MSAPSAPFTPEVLTDSNFDLERALSGVPVTFEQSIATGETISTKTGFLKRHGGNYTTIIEGVNYVVNSMGRNVDETDNVHTQLYLVEATIVQTYGTQQAWTRGPEAGTDPGTIVSLEPRDHFAIAVLQTIIGNLPNAESVNDSAIMQYSYAAYRWAQGMMIAAADSRAAATTPSGGAIDVSQSDLQGNSEKLLYNIAEYMKNGVTIKGTTAAGTVPVQTQTEIADKAQSVAPTTINIAYSIYKTKFIRMEIASPYMAYSDVSVVFELAVTESGGASTRKVSFIIPKGSVIVVEGLDADVLTITSVTSATVRGKDVNDPNTYAFA